ncbi:gastrula zinc finger protein XlCGF26.1-like [Conger conger]|uniref:gastrula zinc finger protein XlCGF26.1-like n=1 Tax=Conger conger TaxID=82655 RepID=UPI002A5AE912|nr:gastrula zinc finger protein XlCGF26.1-like [Conger conger]
MLSFPSLQVQVASILEVLAKTAVVEITKLVDDGSAVWRLEMCRSQRENETLKTKLLLMEGELRAVRGYGEGTSGAAAANGGEGPLCKEEELHMPLCPAGDPEKELQAELKQEPEEQPLTPTLPLLESADWGMELQGVWSMANSLRVDQEQNGQCGGSSEHGEARLDDDFSPPHYTDSQRPHSEKGEGSASHLEQKQNGCPLDKECSHGLPDEVSTEMAFPLGSPGECDGSAPCEAGSDTSAEAKSPCRTEGQEEEFICTRCGKTFPDALELKTHEEQHSAGKRFSCSECGKGFTSSSVLEKHELVHSREKPFSCSVCDKSFSQSHVLKAHESTHTGQKLYACVGKRLKTLEAHQRVHSREKPFTCEQCGKCFSMKSNLKTHQVTHTGVKCFRCTVCKKSFAYLHVLKQHQRVHTGEKPYCCNECGKSFTQRGNLKTHQRVHTKEKPHCCNQCGKSFARLDHLKTHQKVHMGEKPFWGKPFSCTLCRRSFSQNRTLQRHVLSHNQDSRLTASQRPGAINNVFGTN